MKDKKRFIPSIVLLILGLFIIGFVAGMKFSGAFLIGCSFLWTLYIVLDSGKDGKHAKFCCVVKRIMLVCVCVCLLLFIVIEGFIIYGSFDDEIHENTKYMVVLGAGLNGSTPSLMLKTRLDKAVEVLRESDDLKVIVTGGKGVGETITEAYAMKEYLIRHGVDESRIYMEDKSTSTDENLKFAKELIKEIDDDIDEIILISSEFHLYRARVIAQRHGFDISAVGADTPLWLLPNYYLREFFSVIKMLVWK